MAIMLEARENTILYVVELHLGNRLDEYNRRWQALDRVEGQTTRFADLNALRLFLAAHAFWPFGNLPAVMEEFFAELELLDVTLEEPEKEAFRRR